MFGVLADLVVILHFSFVLFVIGGGLLVFKWRWVMWVHLPAALWGTLVEFNGWICPLTPLEVWLRVAGGESGYESGFIDHYVVPLLYPSHLTRELQILLGMAVIIINITMYSALFLKNRKS